MQVIAHRGALHEAQENSWSAFAAAIDAKADRIELDVHLTRDRVPVILHDGDLERATGFAGNVADITIDEFRKIRLRNGEPIPLLEEVVEKLLPQIELNIETKGQDRDCPRETGAIVMNSPFRDRVIFSSFSCAQLEYFRDHHPDIRRACLWGCPEEVDITNFSILAPQVFLERIETNIFHPIARGVTQLMMENARLRGWIVYPWDSVHGEEKRDAEGLWTALKTWGVDGLCSNFPRQLRSWVDEAESDERRFL
jgi:glycerophosphoryl diester phosphodiesterase